MIFFHGEPTWSFLWRKVIPPVLDAGFRCIAPDLPGFGRSDKPNDLDWYSYDRHASAIAPLLEELDVRDATVVVHDWGGPIGLRLAVEHPDRIARMVILDTGLFTGHQKMTEAWIAVPELRRADRGPAGRLPRPRRLQARSGRCRDRRVRRAVSEPGVQGRRAGVPADAPDLARDAGGGGGRARARGAAQRRAAEADPVGRLRSRAAAADRASGSPRRSAPRSTT